MPVHQCYSSISSSDFRDYSWVRLGLDVGIWLRLYFWIKMLFQGQQNMLTQEHVITFKHTSFSQGISGFNAQSTEILSCKIERKN